MLFFLQSGKCVAETNATDRVFTEDMGSNHSTYNVWTVDKDCHFPNDSTPASITIQPPKPRGKKQKAEMTVMHFVFRLSFASIMML